jgi:hypothetical protein
MLRNVKRNVLLAPDLFSMYNLLSPLSVLNVTVASAPVVPAKTPVVAAADPAMIEQ